MNIRLLGVLILCGAFGCFGQASASGDDLPQGVALYAEGDFSGAEKVFEKLVEERPTDPHMLYNLGNVYFRQGFIGRAIWAYRSAAALDPRDADIRWNLNLLTKTLVDRSDEVLSWQRIAVEAWLDRISYRETQALALGMLCVNVLLAILRFVLRKHDRVMGQIVGVNLLVFTVLVLTLGIAQFEYRVPEAVIVDREVYARYGPSESETRAFLLHEGTRVKILKSENDWRLVLFGKAQRGWMPASSLKGLKIFD